MRCRASFATNVFRVVTKLVAGTRLKKCFKDTRFDNSSILNVDIGEALGRNGKNKASKRNQDQHGGEKVNEVQEEFVGLRARNEQSDVSSLRHMEI